MKQEFSRCMRILVVEDHSVCRKVCAAMLTKLEYQVDIATNGQEGVEALRQGSFDLVLMGWRLPVLDGLEATNKIRQHEGSGKRIPIVAVTANAIKGDREKCLTAGMNDYLAKPFEIEDLKEVLDRWLKHGGKCAAAGSGNLEGQGHKK